jgi:hypothetical protein
MTQLAERMDIAVETLQRVSNSNRCIPQGYTSNDEIVAIRTLLRLDRVDEAKERLDLWLNEHHPAWRTG